MRRRHWAVLIAVLGVLIGGGAIAGLQIHSLNQRDSVDPRSSRGVRCTSPTGSVAVQVGEPGVGQSGTEAFVDGASTASVRVCLGDSEGSITTHLTGDSAIPAAAMGTLRGGFGGVPQQWAVGLIRGSFSAVRLTDGSAPAAVLHRGDAGLYPQTGLAIFAQTVSPDASQVVVDVLDSRGRVSSTVTLVRR